MTSGEFDASLVLAAEDCPPEYFREFHRFSRHDERMINALMAHGPVLIRGGRGTGKSALMKEAANRLFPADRTAAAIGIYVSLRNLPLLRATGQAYENKICELLIARLRETLPDESSSLNIDATVASLQQGLNNLSRVTQRRVVVFWDDAAHIGREASLADFFDLFRTISSSSVSCKASIYPGVTRFGNRFDLLNDASVIELSRDDSLPGFAELFLEIVAARFRGTFLETSFSRTLSKQSVFSFIARSVLGNMRAFIFACLKLQARVGADRTIGVTELRDVLLELAKNYYWPLLEEIRPKVGVYGPLIEVAETCAEKLFVECGKRGGVRSALVYRQQIERLAKPFEILEYAGFLSRREVSRAMKSGGRGGRFALNLCNLLERTEGLRLTSDLFERWSGEERDEPVDFHTSSPLSGIVVPVLKENADLAILAEPVDKLGKSNAYPYGLTENLIGSLRVAGFATVGSVASASDAELDAIPGIGPGFIARIRNVLGQAIWM